MTWVTLAILAAFIWALNNIFHKFVLTKWVKDTSLVVLALGLCGLAVGLAIYFFHGFLPMPAWAIWVAILGGALYLVGNWLYFKAAQKEEISKVIPLMYLDPLFTALLAVIFLQEILTPAKYLGILLLVLGAVLISSEKLRIPKSYGAILAIAASVIYAISNIFIKASYSHGDFWTVFAYFRIGSFFGSLLFAVFSYKTIKNEFKSIGLKSAFIFLNELIVLVGAVFFGLAIIQGPISQINALTSVQPFFVFIFATLVTWLFPKIIKEKISAMSLASKLAAIIFIFSGTILLTAH